MQHEANHKNPLGTEKVGALLRKYAIPSVISLIFNTFAILSSLYHIPEYDFWHFR